MSHTEAHGGEPPYLEVSTEGKTIILPWGRRVQARGMNQRHSMWRRNGYERKHQFSLIQTWAEMLILDSFISNKHILSIYRLHIQIQCKDLGSVLLIQWEPVRCWFPQHKGHSDTKMQDKQLSREERNLPSKRTMASISGSVFKGNQKDD